MKLSLMLKKPLDDNWPSDIARLYSPGHMFTVEIKRLTVSSEDPNLDQMTLHDEDLEYFKLIGEKK